MSKYTINSGQTLFDVAINTIADLNLLYVLIQDNGISSIESAPVGLSVSYTPPLVTPPTITSSSFAPQSKTAAFESIANQNVYDITLQTYGDLNLTYQLIQESNFSNILAYPSINTLFIFNPTQVKDAVFASYLSKNNLIINTIQATSVNPSGASFDDSFDDSFDI